MNEISREYPNSIVLTLKGEEMFDLTSDTPLHWDSFHKLYVFKEPSGLIRFGVTQEFYLKYSNYFVEI